MIVVISDLHFEEEQSDYIIDQITGERLGFTRNVNSRAFENFAKNVANYAEEADAKRIDLVFAGDIFDIHRTSLWFTKEGNPKGVRPYVSCTDVKPNSALEKVVINIIEQTAKEKQVKGALEVFQRFADRKYLSSGQEHTLSNKIGEIKLHYIPGNHDRLANATPKIRRLIRQKLGMEASNDPFPHVLKQPDPRVLIRHGHEYDQFNFSVDYTHKRGTFETPPDSEYANPTIGDYATIDFASRLPTLFRELHSDKEILENELLSAIYLRLLEFDDVRPIQAVLPFILSMKRPPGVKRLKQRMWPVLREMIRKLLDELHDDPNLKMMLKKVDKSGPDTIDAVQTLLRTRFWHIPFFRQKDIEWFLRALEDIPRFGKSKGAEAMARRELAVKDGSARFIVAGHTHKPQVALIEESDAHGECYYIDTGTWRNVVMSIQSKNNYRFGRVKALTYLIIYGSDEDPDKSPLTNATMKRESFDFWSGHTQRYFA